MGMGCTKSHLPELEVESCPLHRQPHGKEVPQRTTLAPECKAFVKLLCRAAAQPVTNKTVRIVKGYDRRRAMTKETEALKWVSQTTAKT